MNWSRFGFSAVAALLFACTRAGTHPEEHGGERLNSLGGFDDHTIPHLHEQAQLNAFSFTRAGVREVKFIVTNFSDAKTRAIRFIDARFYRYHDEWYWFRLLNGQTVPGDDEAPFRGRAFLTPGEATEWAKGQLQLPGQLDMVEEGRLYAPRFYQLALELKKPVYGLGSVFQIPARADGTRASASHGGWAFELEYADKVDAERVSTYFSLLAESIPPAMVKGLVFVARSPQQHAFVELMRAQKHPLAASLRVYSELAEPGAVQVYNTGLTAGTLRSVSVSELDSFESKDSEILLLPLVPDYLPAAAGIVSAVPQTPLSHVNLLARNRGIPNVYLGGAAENRHFDQLVRGGMPVVMLAEGGSLVIEALDSQVYELWKRLTVAPLRIAPTADVSHLPYVRRLRASDFEHVEELRPAIGGKAAGMLALLAAGVRVPSSPVALSVRAYVEHLAPAMPLIEKMLLDEEFRKSARVRFLVLEGRESYDAHFTSPQDQEFASEFSENHREKRDALAELVKYDGLTGWIRSKAINAATLDIILTQLRENFPAVVASEGLRFRSSSTIEDIEGFNGAGLYTSNTGFLDAARRSSKKERGRTVEDAILRTWASYWGWEAFEERGRSRVEHLSGSMGLLIHARFQDDLELANGVFSLTINRHAKPSGDVYELELNVQQGAESVTNPRSGMTPEVVRLRASQTGAMKVELLAQASGGKDEATEPGMVLSRAQLESLFRSAVQVGEGWLKQENQRLEAGQKRHSLTLDFEFRLMDARWERFEKRSLGEGAQLIFKQVRSLEPALLLPNPELESAPIPREYLGRAVRAELMNCSGENLRLTALRLWTNSLATPDFGFSREPFVSFVQVFAEKGQADFKALLGGKNASWQHQDFVKQGATTNASDVQNAYSLSVRLTARQGQELVGISLKSGELTLFAADDSQLHEQVSCTARMLLDHPERLLREELSRTKARAGSH